MKRDREKKRRMNTQLIEKVFGFDKLVVDIVRHRPDFSKFEMSDAQNVYHNVFCDIEN